MITFVRLSNSYSVKLLGEANPKKRAFLWHLFQRFLSTPESQSKNDTLASNRNPAREERSAGSRIRLIPRRRLFWSRIQRQGDGRSRIGRRRVPQRCRLTDQQCHVWKKQGAIQT